MTVHQRLTATKTQTKSVPDNKKSDRAIAGQEKVSAVSRPALLFFSAEEGGGVEHDQVREEQYWHYSKLSCCPR